VEVESKGAGHGAVFRVRLPLGAVVPRTPGEEAHAVRPCRILLVEDNVDARDSLATWLELAGHTVQSASDGYAAVEAALSNTFDLALVDLGLPGIDGYEVVSRIRSRLDLPVVAVTGYGQPEDRRRSAEAGFVAHLVKPVAPSALDVVLARISGAEAPGDRSG
jgi:CheY-like chemotaxis protein